MSEQKLREVSDFYDNFNKVIDSEIDFTEPVTGKDSVEFFIFYNHGGLPRVYIFYAMLVLKDDEIFDEIKFREKYLYDCDLVPISCSSVQYIKEEYIDWFKHMLQKKFHVTGNIRNIGIRFQP